MYKYFFLTEFEGHTVSYGPSFSPTDLCPMHNLAWATNQRVKTRIRNLQYGPRGPGWSDIYYISTVWLTGSRTISNHLKQLQICDPS